VLGVLFPAAVSQALRQLGMVAAEEVTRSALRRSIAKGAVGRVFELAAKFLGVRVTEKAVLTKAVPIVGAGIGATWNWVEVRAVGKRAIKYYRGEPIGVRGLLPRLKGLKALLGRKKS